jgi:Rrf2 family transcriptional regulator, iron-sulfur cluster assembly transcription factor
MSDRFRRGRDSGLHDCVRQGNRCPAGRSRMIFRARSRGFAGPPGRPDGARSARTWRAQAKDKYMIIIKDDDYIIFFVDLCIILVNYDDMMCLSQTTGYAVRALICLDKQRGRACLIRDVATCASIPKPYLARIINDLTYKGLVTAKRGYRGGIALARPAGEISLLQIVEAIEGPDWIAPCLLGLNDCVAHDKCPTHIVWQRIAKELKDVMRRTRLADVMPSAARKPARRREKCPR